MMPSLAKTFALFTSLLLFLFSSQAADMPEKDESSRILVTEFDFGRETPEQQKNILKGLEGEILNQLSFINCSALTDVYLTETLNLAHLTKLTLTGTTGTSDTLFPLLAKNCNALKEIYLIQLASLQYIGDWGGFFGFFQFLFCGKGWSIWRQGTVRG